MGLLISPRTAQVFRSVATSSGSHRRSPSSCFVRARRPTTLRLVGVLRLDMKHEGVVVDCHGGLDHVVGPIGIIAFEYDGFEAGEINEITQASLDVTAERAREHNMRAQARAAPIVDAPLSHAPHSRCGEYD